MRAAAGVAVLLPLAGVIMGLTPRTAFAQDRRPATPPPQTVETVIDNSTGLARQWLYNRGQWSQEQYRRVHRFYTSPADQSAMAGVTPPSGSMSASLPNPLDLSDESHPLSSPAARVAAGLTLAAMTLLLLRATMPHLLTGKEQEDERQEGSDGEEGARTLAEEVELLRSRQGSISEEERAALVLAAEQRIAAAKKAIAQAKKQQEAEERAAAEAALLAAATEQEARQKQAREEERAAAEAALAAAAEEAEAAALAKKQQEAEAATIEAAALMAAAEAQARQEAEARALQLEQEQEQERAAAETAMAATAAAVLVQQEAAAAAAAVAAQQAAEAAALQQRQAAEQQRAARQQGAYIELEPVLYRFDGSPAVSKPPPAVASPEPAVPSASAAAPAPAAPQQQPPQQVPAVGGWDGVIAERAWEADAMAAAAAAAKAEQPAKPEQPSWPAMTMVDSLKNSWMGAASSGKALAAAAAPAAEQESPAPATADAAEEPALAPVLAAVAAEPAPPAAPTPAAAAPAAGKQAPENFGSYLATKGQEGPALAVMGLFAAAASALAPLFESSGSTSKAGAAVAATQVAGEGQQLVASARGQEDGAAARSVSKSSSSGKLDMMSLLLAPAAPLFASMPPREKTASAAASPNAKYDMLLSMLQDALQQPDFEADPRYDPVRGLLSLAPPRGPARYDFAASLLRGMVEEGQQAQQGAGGGKFDMVWDLVQSMRSAPDGCVRAKYDPLWRWLKEARTEQEWGVSKFNPLEGLTQWGPASDWDSPAPYDPLPDLFAAIQAGPRASRYDPMASLLGFAPLPAGARDKYDMLSQVLAAMEEHARPGQAPAKFDPWPALVAGIHAFLEGAGSPSKYNPLENLGSVQPAPAGAAPARFDFFPGLLSSLAPSTGDAKWDFLPSLLRSFQAPPTGGAKWDFLPSLLGSFQKAPTGGAKWDFLSGLLAASALSGRSPYDWAPALLRATAPTMKSKFDVAQDVLEGRWLSLASADPLEVASGAAGALVRSVQSGAKSAQSALSRVGSSKALDAAAAGSSGGDCAEAACPPPMEAETEPAVVSQAVAMGGMQ